MKYDSIAPDFSLLYIKATQSFNECIRNKDNEFLRAEINIPLDDIIVIENNIKIVFSKRRFEQCKFEVSLLLLDGSKEIGKYLYIENSNEEEVDDSLVFY
jgi:hypothetical protein